MQRPLVNITVVTHNRLTLTRRTIESVLRHTRESFALCVVDNASTDGTPSYLRELLAQGKIQHLTLFAKNMGVACACNTGFAAFDADYFLKLDNDIEVLHQGWLENLAQFFKPGSSVGAVAYKVIPDNATPSLHIGPTAVFEVEFCGGACLLTTRAVRAALGNFCEDYGVYGEEDSDFGVRVGMNGHLNIFVDGTGHVLHNSDQGYESRMQPIKSRQARKRNIEQFQANIHAYDTGLRPLFVDRKYIPVYSGDLSTCTLSEPYKRDQLAWNRFRKVIRYATRDIVCEHLAQGV
jgi:glycosyltransferase involved in cell wall biosynthesis